jgi:Uncharacterized conserved protein (COG2071)
MGRRDPASAHCEDREILFTSGSNDRRRIQHGYSMSASRKFLTAEWWRSLAMLNYQIDPAILAPYVPAGTELDSYKGVFYVSVVGFLFLRTRVLGASIPGHRDFEEVNLRFYVRRNDRREVVFLKEIVPKTSDCSYRAGALQRKLRRIADVPPPRRESCGVSMAVLERLELPARGDSRRAGPCSPGLC